MRAKASLFLGIVFLFCLSNLSYTQKLSEEDALEGSANLMSPDDEDFNEVCFTLTIASRIILI